METGKYLLAPLNHFPSTATYQCPRCLHLGHPHNFVTLNKFGLIITMRLLVSVRPRHCLLLCETEGGVLIVCIRDSPESISGRGGGAGGGFARAVRPFEECALDLTIH